MGAEPAASWKGLLGEFCSSDEGLQGPAVPPTQEEGPLSSGLDFLVEGLSADSTGWEKPSPTCPGLLSGVQ